MPNLMLTNYCNYKCSYCFGKDIMFPKNPRQMMSRETFNGLVEWVKKGPSDNVFHLMGGEPTLHPDIDYFVGRLLEEDMHITIFSNLATPGAVSLAEKVNKMPVRWVVNVNDPAKWNSVQREHITKALELLGPQASLTFNVMPDEDDNLWALEYTKKYHLNNRIKVGFLLPTCGGSGQSDAPGADSSQGRYPSGLRMRYPLLCVHGRAIGYSLALRLIHRVGLSEPIGRDAGRCSDLLPADGNLGFEALHGV